jgi:hypothetical protein
MIDAPAPARCLLAGRTGRAAKYLRDLGDVDAERVVQQLHRGHASATTSSASAQLDVSRYATPCRNGRVSAKIAAASSVRTGPSSSPPDDAAQPTVTAETWLPAADPRGR